MGTTTGIELIQKVEYLLNDVYGADYPKRWTRAELLEWLNDGQLDIVIKVPLANARIINVLLASGPQQQLSSAYHRILAPVCNMGVGGATFGTAITTTTMLAISGSDSNWLSATASNVVINIIPSETLRDFYVYPPVSTGTYIRLQAAKIPSKMTDTSEAIEIEESYSAALKYFMLQMAFSKEADLNPKTSRALMFSQLYLQALGLGGGGGQ